MHPRILSLIYAVDQALAECSLPVSTEQGVLLSFLFHSVFKDEAEAQSGLIDPQQGITVAMLREFLSHFQKHAYEFVSAKDVLGRLPAGGRYVLLTFDDGYYNNIRVLPVLEELHVPAVLFISSNHVKLGRAFWWDVVYREGKKRGCSEIEIRNTIAGYKRHKAADVEILCREQYGANALVTASDLDRPFTPLELRKFASHPLISLGNHTSDHAILTNYSPAEACAQIQAAQNDICAMTGRRPDMIAYPNGNESPAVVDAAYDAGLHLGFGVCPGRNRLPLRPGSRHAMRLKRFTLTSQRNIESQCKISRSALSLDRLLRNVKSKSVATAIEV
jgi:peptidoglycan/xylan/chitin deacetylase (PgdA/CDA1 family)